MEKSSSSEEKDGNRMPRAVPFIVANVFLERFSTGGILAILALFIHRKLGFDPNMSTALYHTFEFFIYCFTLFGAIVAESWIGLFKTISWMSLVYSIGAAVVSIGGVEPLNLPFKVFAIVGLITTVIGSGSLKSNVSAFGGNQFKLPEQAQKLTSFFSIQYFALKCGSTIARASFPIMREEVQCFGMYDCYPLPFALSSAAMFTAFLIMLCGKRSFIQEPSNHSMFIKVIGCVITGAAQKLKINKTVQKDHWLDYAEEKYGASHVKDTKKALSVLLMYLPLPIFWALHAQQGSRWVFQATKMNGDVGGWYTIKPDQMIVLNSVLGIVLIPVFDYFIYPALAKIGLKTCLQKITMGGVCTALAFIAAAILEFQIEKGFISILWMLPQYFLLCMGEILLYTANLNFTYTEAPSSMKSVMLGFSYLSVAGGALIVVLISGVAFFESQAYEFLFFAGIMTLDIFIFGFLATRYKYSEPDKPKIVS